MKRKKKNRAKPSPEAKALSLFLMAYKTKDPIYKEVSKSINRQWDLMIIGQLEKSHYAGQVDELLTSYGGYEAVVEKTVKYYIDKTGEWKMNGDDKYCQDARVIANKLMKDSSKKS